MSRRVIVPISGDLLKQVLKLPVGVTIEDVVLNREQWKSGIVTLNFCLQSEDFEDVEVPPVVDVIVTKQPERLVWKFGDKELVYAALH